MDKAKSMVIASFLGDALSMGVHWIYDTHELFSKHGRVQGYITPARKSYHPSKARGEFTHLGDQSFLLLESLALSKGFDLDDFSARWKEMFSHYDGYIDHASRTTMENYEKGLVAASAGSESDELAGASRMAPLVYAYRDNSELLAESAIAQTRMTHDNPITLDAAQFFSSVTVKVLGGTPPVEAMKDAGSDKYRTDKIKEWVETGLESAGSATLQAIAAFGQNCATTAAFPSSVHVIAKYENNLEDALIENIMAGGDNAARGLAIGMVLGAHLGTGAVPESWLTGLAKRDAILDLLQKLE